MSNYLTLAVAGGRKTQGLIDYCRSMSVERRIAFVTFTQTNQQEIRHRLAVQASDHHNLEVLGWYSFLLHHFAKPFLRFKFPTLRVGGFDYEGRPNRMATGKNRFMNQRNEIYSCELGRLSAELMNHTPALLRRLECIYDELLIDEVQDLSGYDWEILRALMKSRITIRLVGDVRQAVLSTNPRGQKNKQYGYAASLEWFRQCEAEGILNINYATTTYRCRKEIAEFSDSIFDSSWAFPPTISENDAVTGHDGVFLVKNRDVESYIEQFQPQCLRNTAASAKKLPLNFMNFKISKGATFARVLIAPTKNIEEFVKQNIYLEATSAASFYVAVTRAEQSVAIIIDNPGESRLPVWAP
ncbi:UvrD-helicase domain-containing protein [Pectobacterium brasiliense]|uniref:UvrD-helicase domain-containing protein n=1 Tax=Pectobacterium brasiliense TaxID=180957 RepID=UPI000B97C9BF|nr:UvrD-helicase domain-containing protein [Pectobacterium carotovorum]OYN49662.1 ATP-dependent exonuclease [Pectobacterium carotovorum]